MNQPLRKTQKFRKIQEAQLFLQHVNAINQKTRIKDDNFEEKTSLEKYIKSKKELAEIEISERQTCINERKKEIKQKKYGIFNNNNRVNPNEDRQVSNLSLKINKILEQIKEQDQEIKNKQSQIEKLKKPQKKFKNDYIDSMKTLEEQIKAKESELYLLKYYQNNRNDPEKIAQLMKTLNPLIVPEDSVVPNENLWLESGSQVGRTLQENYIQIKKLDEDIENHEKILLEGPENDFELQESIRERHQKEFEMVHSKFERKKEKKLKDLKFVWDNELQKLKVTLDDLKQQASLVYLKHKK